MEENGSIIPGTGRESGLEKWRMSGKVSIHNGGRGVSVGYGRKFASSVKEPASSSVKRESE